MTSSIQEPTNSLEEKYSYLPGNSKGYRSSVSGARVKDQIAQNMLLVLLHVCLVAQSCPTLCNPMDCSPPGSSIHQDSPGKNTGVGYHALLHPGIKPKSPSMQVDSLPAEPPGKPKNTGVGSLSLLQGIFPTKESNQGHLRCGRICYQLSHQGRPLALLSLRKLHGFEELYAKNQGQRTMCILSHG